MTTSISIGKVRIGFCFVFIQFFVWLFSFLWGLIKLNKRLGLYQKEKKDLVSKWPGNTRYNDFKMKNKCGIGNNIYPYHIR